MILAFKIIFLLIFFGISFAFIPNFAYVQVKRLLVYHKYKEEAFKKRFLKVMKVYLTLGLTLGIVFIFLLSPTLNPKMESASNFSFKGYSEIFSLSFLVSFSLAIILRISVLLNKSRIAAKFLPKKAEKDLLAKSSKGDYSGLKRETESFLFSIFLASLLSIMVYFFYKLIFEPTSLIQLPQIQFTFQSLIGYFIFIILFILVLAIITVAGEGLLSYFGVYPKCDEATKE